MSKHPPHLLTTRAIPKLCGADIELGNFIAGIDRTEGTGFESSRALLAKIQGLPIRQNTYFDNWWSAVSTLPSTDVNSHSETRATTRDWAWNQQHVCRRFLATNGSSAYIDLNHVELCQPEVMSAFDHVAAWHGMLRIMRDALDRANEDRTDDLRIQVLVNNSDGLGNSYGSHTNYQISRQAFDNLFRRKPHYLAFLASFQVSSILLTGQGKVGSENGRPPPLTRSVSVLTSSKPCRAYKLPTTDLSLMAAMNRCAVGAKSTTPWRQRAYTSFSSTVPWLMVPACSE